MKKHPKILLVTTHYCPLIGGALSVYDALARELAPNMSILTAEQDYTTGVSVDGWQEFDRKAPYPIFRRQAMRPPLKARWGLVGRLVQKVTELRIRAKILSAMDRIIREKDIDIVVIGALDALGWLVDAVHDKWDLPVSIYVHGEEVNQKAFNLRMHERRQSALSAADGLIAVSSFTQQVMEKDYAISGDKIQVISNGVHLSRFGHIQKPKSGEKAQTQTVLSVGRLVARKGFDRLLEAWPQVLQAVPEAKLVIYGMGPLKSEMESQVEALGASTSSVSGASSVTLKGWGSDQELAEAYAHADLFVMPNRTMPDGDTEGFGLVFLEASASGLPVIAGRAGGAVDAVVDGETGYFVDGEDCNDIAEKIIALLKDKDKSLDMGKAGWRYARENGWRAKSKEFEGFCKRLIRAKANG